jgi:hemoglobin
MTSVADLDAPTPYDLIGGPAPVRALVERFYDLMESEPAFAALRAMHASDLGPMRESLSGFLIGWLGGPRDWFAAHPGVCMMSAHRSLPITRETAGQWIEAMGRALRESDIEPGLAGDILNAFSRMAANIAARG